MSESFAGIAWRTLFTAFSFTLFGMGALVLSVVVLPVIHLISHTSSLPDIMQVAVRYSYQLTSFYYSFF